MLRYSAFLCYIQYMKKRWICSAICVGLLAGCQNTPVSGSADADPLAGYTELPEENRYRVYEKNDLKAFITNGSGVVVLADQNDEDCVGVVYIVHDLLETYDMSCGYYDVTDSHDSEIVQWISDGVQDETLRHSDEIEEPLVLFVEEGSIVSAYDGDWFEEHISNVVELMEDMESMRGYLKEREVNGCDDGCTLGG